MRPLWKGAISFGLVTIPVSLYPAIAREELKFRMLRKNDLSPINYKRVAETDGKEVPWDHIVKGYEDREGKIRRSQGGGLRAGRCRGDANRRHHQFRCAEGC